MRRITNCEVCGSNNLISALDLGSQPMCDDLVPVGSPLKPRSYPLEILACPTCFTFHQAVQVERELLFPKSYHYRSSLTADVIDGMKELVNSTQNHIGNLSGLTVLDVGCNDGSLLSIFSGEGAVTCGIEPTDAFKDINSSVYWKYQGYFDDEAVEAFLEKNDKPDIITFTNVFAHINNLNLLLTNLKLLIGKNTKLVIENHYMGAVSKLQQFDTFYHEHPRTYSLTSFRYIASKLGLSIEKVEFPERYSGNIRIFMGSSKNIELPALNEKADFDNLLSLEPIIQAGTEQFMEELEILAKKYGPLPAKAFPGRAAITINRFGITDKLIDVTYEKPLSPKIGNYIPGTTISIRNENEFFANRIDSPVLINMAWHIHDEITHYMRSKGYKEKIIKAWIKQ